MKIARYAALIVVFFAVNAHAFFGSGDEHKLNLQLLEEYGISKWDIIRTRNSINYLKAGNTFGFKEEALQIKDLTILDGINWYLLTQSYSSGHYKSLNSLLNKYNNLPKKEIVQTRLIQLAVDSILTDNYKLIAKEEAILTISGQKPANLKSLLALVKIALKYTGKEVEPAPQYKLLSLIDARTIRAINAKNPLIIESARKIWAEETMPDDVEKDFLRVFEDFLQQEDIHKKIDKLIFQKQFISAKRLILMANESYKALFMARIGIATSETYSDLSYYLSKVPEELKKDEGLLYDLCTKLIKYNDNNAVQKILKISTSGERWGQNWWKIRHAEVRSLIDDRKYEDAFLIAKNHGELKDEDYVEAQWLCGWLALRFLRKPDLAISYFANLYNKSNFGVSVSRGAYWLARSYEQKGDSANATKWYEIAASYPFFYYGQMANLKLPRKDALYISIDKVNNQEPTMQHLQESKINGLLKMALLFAATEDFQSAKIFSTSAIDSASSMLAVKQIVKTFRLLGNKELLTHASRYAARKQATSIEDAFVLIDSSEVDPKVRSTVNAIIRQESAFNVSAQSSKGALGFMQLMPATARLVAKQIGVPYNEKALRENAEYNMKLGSYYYISLLNRFNGAPFLAIGAYNGGPGSVQNWIKKYGDPRELRYLDDTIDWVEQIPFKETRNYIMRVIEGKTIYDYIIDRKADIRSNFLTYTQ